MQFEPNAPLLIVEIKTAKHESSYPSELRISLGDKFLNQHLVLLTSPTDVSLFSIATLGLNIRSKYFLSYTITCSIFNLLHIHILFVSYKNALLLALQHVPVFATLIFFIPISVKPIATSFHHQYF